MACEIQYQQYLKTRSDADSKIYQDCLNRAEKGETATREHAAKEAEAARTAALYSQIHATSAELAKSRLPTGGARDYSKYLQTGAQYAPPGAPGFMTKTTAGIGQGLLIFGILGGGMLMMLLMFFMVKPRTVQRLPGFKKKK